MKKVQIYNVFDCISETYLGNFFANSEIHAKSIFEQFLENNPSISADNLSLILVSEFDSPVVPEDKECLKVVENA